MADYDYQAELKKKLKEEEAASESDTSDETTSTDETDTQPVEEEVQAEKKKLGGPGYQIQFIRQEEPGEPPPKEEAKPAPKPAGPTFEEPGAAGPESFTEPSPEEKVMAPPPEPTKVIAPPPAGGPPVYDVETPEDVTHYQQERPTPPVPAKGTTGFDVADPDPENPDYKTPLAPDEEKQFRKWVKDNNIPFDDSPQSDYDMRGYWKAQQEGDQTAQTDISQFDQKPHFPDTFKTPFHKTFSNESQYATSDAPHWDGDKLIDNKGNVVADETPPATKAQAPDFSNRVEAFKKDMQGQGFDVVVTKAGDGTISYAIKDDNGKIHTNDDYARFGYSYGSLTAEKYGMKWGEAAAPGQLTDQKSTQAAAVPGPAPTPSPTPNVQVGTMEDGKFVPTQPEQQPDQPTAPTVKIPETIMGMKRIEKEAADAKPDTTVDTELPPMNAPNGKPPVALIIHHTSGRNSAASVVEDWRTNRPGVGAQMIVDRDGTLHYTQKEFGYGGTGNFLHSVIPGVSNQTAVGIEVIAKDDADMTPAQLKTLQRLAGPNGPYANTRVYGHSQVSPNDRDNEGVRGVNAINEARRSGVAVGTISTDQGDVPLRGYITTKATQFGHFDPEDPGIGAPRLGTLDTNDPRLIALAVPEEELRRQFGNHPEVWRRVRADVVLSDGRHVMVPIADIGPSDEQLAKGIGVDLPMAYPRCLIITMRQVVIVSS